MSNRATVRGLLMLLPVAIALLVFACGEKPRLVQEGPITSQTIVATVDTAKITLGEVLSEYTGLTIPGSRFSATLENALNEVIYRKCAFLGADKFRDYDKKEISRLAQNRARDVIIQYMLQDLFAKQVQVSESSIDSAYRANLASLSEPERRRVTHLLVSNNPKAWEADGVDVSGLTAEQLDAKAKVQIEKFYQEVKGGANLGDLAAKYSHDSNSKPKRGDTGLFARGQMVDEFEKVAFRLPKGALSTPFKSPYGWHILRVEEIVDSTVQPLDSALHATIEQQLKSSIHVKLGRSLRRQCNARGQAGLERTIASEAAGRIRPARLGPDRQWDRYCKRRYSSRNGVVISHRRSSATSHSRRTQGDPLVQNAGVRFDVSGAATGIC